jgi:Uma2 family endonuclease
MATKEYATLDDLRHVHGKAELVDGEIVHMTPSGGRHGYASREIVASLRNMSGGLGEGTPSVTMLGFASRCRNGSRSVPTRLSTSAR